MTQIIELIKKAREDGKLDDLVQAMPYSRFLGISIETSNDELIGKLTYSDHLVGNAMIPALHGGTIGALLESTAIFTLMMKAETARLPKTINITVEFLRTGRAVDTFARAEFTRLGRRVASVRAFAWQEDRNKPIAAANAHFLVAPP